MLTSIDVKFIFESEKNISRNVLLDSPTQFIISPKHASLSKEENSWKSVMPRRHSVNINYDNLIFVLFLYRLLCQHTL